MMLVIMAFRDSGSHLLPISLSSDSYGMSLMSSSLGTGRTLGATKNFGSSILAGTTFFAVLASSSGLTSPSSP